jgi:hypothetical protein
MHFSFLPFAAAAADAAAAAALFLLLKPQIQNALHKEILKREN